MVEASEQEKATRRWRLIGYGKVDRKTVVVHDSTCVGDRALDTALASLEGRADVTRAAVEPL